MAVVIGLCIFSWLAAGFFGIRDRKICGARPRKKLFERMADGILSCPAAAKLYSVQVKQYLKQLYPAKELNEVCKNFYREKIIFVLKVWFAGIHLTALLAVSQQTESLLKEGNVLERGLPGESEQPVILEVYTQESGKGTMAEIPYEINAQTYSPEDIKNYLDRFQKECETLIRGENQSLRKVKKDLILRESYDSYPMQFLWNSSDYSLLDEDGTVYNEDIEEACEIVLTAVITYDEIEQEQSFVVQIWPKDQTPEELWYKETLSAIRKADDEQKHTGFLRLPNRIAGKQVYYVMPQETTAVLYPVFLVLVVVVLFFAKDNDLKKETEQRKQRLSLKYPEFVSKFQLLLGAGMTVRNVIWKLSEDSSLGKDLGQELELLVRDIKNGLSVREALDRFGKRTAHPLYMKFAALLTQNLKKGTGDLLEQLSKEAAEAFTLRKTNARQLGEEAGTKLLGPMVLMLAIVMAVLIIPAFLSFQI